ncbi:type IX secretion system membrane protein PorP/SprF [Pedobacter sp. HDW13]|uniref:PorP/SprF family type IX secretion system membrane protein n=1 Tax=Pedobacter sp. HDW13 TaxID=2714940 RepID=UPI00140D82A9|nr:type IX secretion system membrane protein PorP/SprF [Pedobacter sp. HDW13]QIL41205.1 type IX secretion system membrane protein PorP/SprF [Pedobacter sp. HDW13]
MKKHFARKNMLVLCLTIAVTFQLKAQQNIQFTQYIFNSLSVNPAYAGYKEEWFGQLGLRSQWTGLEGAPKTGQLSIDGVADANKNIGLGLQITDDRLGPQNATSVYANYAYRLRLDEDDTQRLSFGLAAGISQYGLDGNKLRPVDGDDANLPIGKINSTIPDIRFGVYYYNPKFYVGLSAMDLFSGQNSNRFFNWNSNTIENIRRKRHYYLIAGAMINLSDDTKLRPSMLFKEDLKGPSSLDIGGMLIFGGRFWIGGSYRTEANLWKKRYEQGQTLSSLNSISGITQIYINNQLRVGYSYDYIISELSSFQNGTHEITLGITFPGKNRRVLSPRFF